MKRNYFYLILTSTFLLSACQVDQGDIQSGVAPRAASRMASESDISDIVDSVDNVANEMEAKADVSRNKKDPLQILSNNYTNFPSTYDISDYINDSLTVTPSTCSISPEEMEAYNTDMLGAGSLGARQVLATIYQSCNAIDFVMDENTPKLQGVTTRSATFDNGQVYKQRVINSKDKMVNSHEILKGLKSDPNFPAEGCIDTTKQPPVYGYGSRKWLRGEKVNLFTRGAGVANNGVKSSGIDCSEFISAAFAVEGLKFSTADTDFNSLTTTSLFYTSQKKNSCVKDAKFNLPYSMQSGDVINFKGKHVVMVDSVGRDPLGIRKHSEAGTCDDVTIGDFDFTYIHSGALNNYGPARVEAKIHETEYSTLFRNLLVQAKKSCWDIVNKRTFSKAAVSSRFQVLRHDGANPACYFDKPAELKGGECVEKCLSERKKNDH